MSISDQLINALKEELSKQTTILRQDLDRIRDESRISTSDQLINALKEELSKQTTILRQDLDRIRDEVRQLRGATREKISSFEERLVKTETELLEVERSSLPIIISLSFNNKIIIAGLELDDENFVQNTIAELNELLKIDLAEDKFNNILKLVIPDHPLLK
ncbi:hypothetical protein HHI36_009803 [Cryptolaemus montrouzieri]|uniref:Uncharacterized protein n=1 Tax=Cryptolaemus montrouzieri TaxID=559131 RepID=A0ABD2MGX0_9CUCU